MKIMFLCHGNICRSPMAEFVMKDLVRKAGAEGEFLIGSGAVSDEETGNGIYPNTKSLLYAKGIPIGEHRAHKITKEEFDMYDLIIVMDRSNLSLLSRIVGRDCVFGSGKVHLLMEYAGKFTAVTPATESASESASGHAVKENNLSGHDGDFGYPDVADPWYTRDFERSYRDILAGCKGLLSAYRNHD